MSNSKQNSFIEFELSINQKAIFQPTSHEAKSFDNKKSITLIRFCSCKS